MVDKATNEQIESMLRKGQDPKDMVIQACRKGCKGEEDKLHRCETALKNMVSVEPEMTW